MMKKGYWCYKVNKYNKMMKLRAYLNDNARDEEDNLENDDINFNEDLECLFCCNNSLRKKIED